MYFNSTKYEAPTCIHEVFYKPLLLRPVMSKYSPQYPVLKYAQYEFFLQSEWPSFKPIENW
jgi:hypothetical protein